jgi:prepilin-type N-terminal cleavage/methylation domain-containing protein
MLVRNVSKTSTRSAFTLTEMLVVVAIIVVLAGIAVPITMGVLGESKKKIAAAHIKGTLVPAVQRYQLNHNEQLPGSLQEIIEDRAVGLKVDQLKDPWGNLYQFTPGSSRTQEGFEIHTTAPDGEVISNVQ